MVLQKQKILKASSMAMRGWPRRRERARALEDIFESVQLYCKGAPATDDCTMMEVSYTRA